MEIKNPLKWDLKKRISPLLFDDALSDVTYLVDDPPYPYHCHKLILATGSQVFRAMLYGKMAEKSEIFVPDVTAVGFSIMLRYLYTDEVKIESEAEAFETAYVSKKYLIKSLFQACEDYLVSHAAITVETVFPLHEEATFLEMEKLKNSCLKYVSRNANKIFHCQPFLQVSMETLQDVLSLDLMHIDSEEEIVEALWKWGRERCKENGWKNTVENVRNSTSKLLKYVRFLSLDTERLEILFKKFQFLDQSEQLAILWNVAMPKRISKAKMPSNLCGEFRRRSISSSTRLELPTDYRYDGNMTNYSVKSHEQQVDITATGPGITIVGVVTAFKPIPCYSSLHRELLFELTASNMTTNIQTCIKSSQKSEDQNNNKEQENELFLDDYIMISEGDIGNLTVRVAGEGIRMMQSLKEEFSCKTVNSSITFTFKTDGNSCMFFPIKEIMCIPG